MSQLHQPEEGAFHAVRTELPGESAVAARPGALSARQGVQRPGQQGPVSPRPPRTGSALLRLPS